MLISTFGSCSHNTSLDKRILASFQVYLLLQGRRKQSAIQKIYDTKPCLVRRSISNGNDWSPEYGKEREKEEAIMHKKFPAFLKSYLHYSFPCFHSLCLNIFSEEG